jgi:hypothetical protein
MVRRLVRDDHGLYECIARNALGAETVSVMLSGPTAPDMPTGLRALNRTEDSITLAWTPGFDGGFPQSFQFRYYNDGKQQ